MSLDCEVSSLYIKLNRRRDTYLKVDVLWQGVENLVEGDVRLFDREKLFLHLNHHLFGVVFESALDEHFAKEKIVLFLSSKKKRHST